MATGDLKNNLRKLKTELRKINYDKSVLWDQINVGLTEPLLPILHYLFADYSCELTSFIAYKGYEMFGKSDLRFIEVIYKILINEFSTKPMLTKHQFFTVGFTEIKVIFVTKIIFLCRTKSDQIISKLHKNKKKHVVKSKEMSFTSDKSIEKSNNIPLHDSVDFQVEHHQDHNAVSNSYQTKQEFQCNNSILDLTAEPEEVNINSNNKDQSDVIFITSNNSDESIHQDHPVLKSVFVQQQKEADISDIEEEDDVLDVTEDALNITEDGSVVEVFQNKNLPKFTIQKHPIPVVKVIHNPNTEDVIAQESDSRVFCDKCNLCSKNEKALEDLALRFSVLENNFSQAMTVNNELSAKVILLETKLKFLEAASIQSLDVTSSHDQVSEKSRKTLLSPVNNDAQDEAKATKRYSPIKYSDDEVITKDFRPIRMKDIRRAQGLTDVDKNKENDPMLPSLPVPKENTEITNVCFDSKTKDTIASVKKYLQETDMLLLSK